MRLSYKYRIYPTQKQQDKLNNIFYLCRFLYNSALQERISYYKKYGKSLTYNKQANQLSEIKDILPDYFQNIYSQVSQQVLKQVDDAYKNFFRKIKTKYVNPGFPRFKNNNRFRSICFPQVSSDLINGPVKILNNKLVVFGIPGNIRIKFHRSYQGIPKQVRITKEPGNKYFIVISCNDVPVNILPETNLSVGIDLGLNTFIVSSDNNQNIKHPKPWKTSKEKLSFKQQKLSKKQKQSQNSRRLRNEIANQHAKVSNIRKDFHHKTAHNLVKQYDKIYVEDLKVTKMIQNEEKLSKNENILDAAWSQFIQILIYKAERAGKKVILVNPKNTSKTCHVCDWINENLTEKDREFICGNCSFQIDRDLNAAKNIKRFGMNLAITNNIISEASV